MGNRNFEQSTDPKEHIESDLADSGVVAPEEWREAFNLEERPEFSHIGLIEAFLKAEDRVGETDASSYQEELERVKGIKDSCEKLEAIGNMNIFQAIEFVRLYGTDGAFHYLNNRLIFYKKLINGEEISIKEESTEYSEEKKEFITKTVLRKEKKEGAANPKTIAIGLWRDIYYAAMQGTPEMAAVKIATRMVNEEGVKTKKNIEKAVVKLGSDATPYNTQFLKLQDRARSGLFPRSVVQFRGYESGVYQGYSGDSVYGELTALYRECEKEVKSKVKQKGKVGNKDADDADTEHRAVLLMAGRLKGAFEYGGLIDKSNSPYSASLKEAVVAGRLGHKVMRQMRGMRQKIQSTNFEHIERFIGKSGDNRYEHEKKRLDSLVRFFSLRDDKIDYKGVVYQGYGERSQKEAYDRILALENEDAILRQAQWFANETEKLDKKFEKSKTEVEKANLPAEEKDLQLQSVIVNHESVKTALQTDYDTEFARLNIRTPEQLLSDLKKRQEIVNARYEKRKSLAQKALDLHFRINHVGREYGSKPLSGIVDWINDAPLGTIKHAHKMMWEGMKDESIIEYALAETIAGARGFTREDLKIVHDLVEEVKKQDDSSTKRKLEGMMKVGSAVSRFGYQLSIDEVAELSTKNYIGMSEALQLYSLAEVKGFMEQNLHLSSVASVRRVTREHGYDLPIEEITEMIQHNTEGLDKAFHCFDLEAIKTLLSHEVHLLTAVGISDDAKRFGHNLSVLEVVEMASHNIAGLGRAFSRFDLKSVKTLLSQDADLLNAVTISDNAKRFHYSISIDKIAQVSKTTSESFLRALDLFPLPSLDKMLAEGVNLDEYFFIRDMVIRKKCKVSDDDLIFWTKKMGQLQNHIWQLEQIIDLYGIKRTGEIITNGFKFSEIFEILSTLQEKGLSQEAAIALTLSVISFNRNACEAAIEHYKHNLSLKGLIWLSERFTPPLEPVLHEALGIFGEDMLTLDQYMAFQRLAKGESVPEMTALGINKVGKEGVSQLRGKISEFRRGLLSSQLDVALIQGNPILNGIVKALVRFDQSSWRQNRAQKFNDVLKSYQHNKEVVAPLPPYMSPSDIRRIDLVDKKQSFQFSEPFLARFGSLHNQLKSAFELYQESKTPFSDLAERTQPLIDKIVKDLEQKKLAITKPEAQKGIQMRIDALQNLNIRAVRKFQDTIRVLSQFNELRDILLQTVFVASLRKNKGYHERVAEQVKNTSPNVESMSFMLDFIDHVTNKETLKQYFSDKQSYNAFKSIVDVKAIEEELARIQNQKTIGTVPIQFVPTRNLLTEFSGDIADACWTGKYDSMLKTYPNFSSVTFVQDPGGANERYVGAALLIETTSAEWEKLLVVRGLNPLENTINRLSVPDFFSQFTAWVKKTAAKDGRKAALVVDDHSGGSGTNRPVLHQHMSSLKAEKVTLASEEGTRFNGYNIVKKCVLI